MEINDLFSHLNNISSSIHTHWNFFSIVALGVATGLALKDKKIERYVGIFLIVALGIFLTSNYYRISQTTEELKIVEHEIELQISAENLSPSFKEFYSKNFSNVNECWYAFHIIIDIFLTLVIIMRTEWKMAINNTYQHKRSPP